MIKLSVRGALNSLFDPSYNIGIISSFFLGNYLNSLDQAKAQLVVPAIFMVLMFVFPETPEFWTNKNKTNVSSSFSNFIFEGNSFEIFSEHWNHGNFTKAAMLSLRIRNSFRRHQVVKLKKEYRIPMNRIRN